jgi:NitT/TauT family transport system substrate-binding protein
MNKDKNDLTGRRGFLKTAAGTIGAVAVSSSFTSFPMYSKEESETLKIGYLPITDAAPLLIAHARGYFREEGLKVERPLRVRSWSTLAESFLAGKFNITHMLLPMPVWMRYNSSIPVKILAWNHTNGSAITVRGNSGIKGFADLEGKQVAVPYWYSMHNVILQMGLKKVGLKPVIRSQSTALKPGEVNLFILPPSEMPAALFGGKIDGYIVAEPFNAIAEMRINARIMRFTGDIWKNHPCCVVVVKESLIRSRPVFIQKVMNSIVRAQLWMTNNPGKAAKILSREGDKYLPIPENVLLRVFTVYDLSLYGDREIRERHEKVPTAIQHPGWNVGRIGFQPYPYPSATRFIIKEMRHTLMEGNTAFLGKLDPDFAAGDLVDDSFVKKAINAVGGPSKFEAINIEHPWTREEVIEL